MIKRTDEYCLDLRDNRWYLERKDNESGYFMETDILFTGLILFVDAERVNEVPYRNEVKICKDGVIIGDYASHPYFSKLANFELLLKISSAMLELAEPYVAVEDTYKGIPFTGVTYSEEEDKDGFKYIDEERLYKNGSEECSLKYFEDGSLKSLNFKYYFDMECSEPNILSFLSIDKDYFTKYPKLEQTSVEEDVIEDASSFSKFKTNKKLVLSGEGITDDILYALSSNKGMNDVKELTLRNISLNQSSYYTLLNLKKLSYLNIEIIIDMMSEVADTIKFVAKELKDNGVKISLRMNKKTIEV